MFAMKMNGEEEIQREANPFQKHTFCILFISLIFVNRNRESNHNSTKAIHR